jgi:hypothetical protein
MLVCSECKQGPCVRNCCEKPPIFREYIPGDQLYSDPMGEPYKGLTNFMQTPVSDPVKPKTADRLLKEREHRFKLRTEK